MLARRSIFQYAYSRGKLIPRTTVRSGMDAKPREVEILTSCLDTAPESLRIWSSLLPNIRESVEKIIGRKDDTISCKSVAVDDIQRLCEYFMVSSIFMRCLTETRLEDPAAPLPEINALLESLKCFLKRVECILIVRVPILLEGTVENWQYTRLCSVFFFCKEPSLRTLLANFLEVNQDSLESLVFWRFFSWSQECVSKSYELPGENINGQLTSTCLIPFMFLLGVELCPRRAYDSLEVAIIGFLDTRPKTEHYDVIKRLDGLFGCAHLPVDYGVKLAVAVLPRVIDVSIGWRMLIFSLENFHNYQSLYENQKIKIAIVNLILSACSAESDLMVGDFMRVMLVLRTENAPTSVPLIFTCDTHLLYSLATKFMDMAIEIDHQCVDYLLNRWRDVLSEEHVLVLKERKYGIVTDH